jgi:hypothetical protein
MEIIKNDVVEITIQEKTEIAGIFQTIMLSIKNDILNQ